MTTDDAMERVVERARAILEDGLPLTFSRLWSACVGRGMRAERFSKALDAALAGGRLTEAGHGAPTEGPVYRVTEADEPGGEAGANS